jgi:transposase
MNEMLEMLKRWQLDVNTVRERVYSAPTTRERERWHAIWLLAQGWTASKVAEALQRDAHTIGGWVKAFGEQGPTSLAFEQSGGAPPSSTQGNRRR